MFKYVIAVFAVLLASPGHAEWYKATSKHFIMYSDADPDEIRETIVKLEKYDHIIRALSQTTKKHSPIKMKVFQVRNMSAVRTTLPYGGNGVGGYYNTTLRGPFAVSTRRGNDYRPTKRTLVGTDGSEWGPEVLQHEYTHHFMYQYFPTVYPTWYSEGFAEFYGTMAFKDNNVVEVGHAPFGRMDTINNDWLSMEKMLTAKSYADVGSQVGSLYAQGWLLVHYGAFNAERGAQLQQYLSAIVAGKSYEVAAKSAFGDDLDALDSELKAHAKNLKALSLTLKPIDVGNVEVRTLTAAENDLMQDDISLYAGIPADKASFFASNVRETAAQYMDDPYALRILIEAERAAGNDANANAAIDRLLAIDPDNGKAMLFKAQQEIEALEEAESEDNAAWNEARKLLIKANNVKPNDPEILTAFYESYNVDGQLPPVPAQNALMAAHELLPQNTDLRYRIASDFERRGMIEEAIFIIQPAAFASPDEDEKEKKERERLQEKYQLAGEEIRETPREMLERLEEQVEQGEEMDEAESVVSDK